MTTLLEVATTIENKIEAFCTSYTAVGWNKDLWTVLYGDQDKLPKRVTICIEPNVKRNRLKNAARGIEREFEVFILIYYASVNDGGQFNRKHADAFAEEIETLLNSDPQFGGKLIHCYVTEVASGYSNKDGTIVKSSRLTFNGMVNDRLPS
jgi:hypothetical protein